MDRLSPPKMLAESLECLASAPFPKNFETVTLPAGSAVTMRMLQKDAEWGDTTVFSVTSTDGSTYLCYAEGKPALLWDEA